jgi:hypothetical protein
MTWGTLLGCLENRRKTSVTKAVPWSLTIYPEREHMLDAAIWKQDGTGEKVVLYGNRREVTRMTFYRHRVTGQLKIIYELNSQ